MPRNNMPPNWDPPAPAWQSVWNNTDDPLIAAYFGIQSNQPTLLDQWADQAFTADNHPASIERGRYTDTKGITNHLYIAYWRRSHYQQWWQQNAPWWQHQQRLDDNIGLWREIIEMPFERFETLHSTESPHGIGVSADTMQGPIMEHGYPGGMRDRIALSDKEDLTNTDTVNTPLQAVISEQGRRVTVTPPQNMCVIRSGQNWSYCDENESRYYLDNVHPVLLEGMQYLRDNPVESHCYSLRFVDKCGPDWQVLTQSFGLGYATDIHAFENWAKSHPTHLAIFGNFLKMVDLFGENMKLRLWHEVCVLPAEGCEFEYINCHQHSGLLRYV